MRVGDSKYIVDFIKDKETGEIYSPYQTIQCATEKDFLNLLSALDRQTEQSTAAIATIICRIEIAQIHTVLDVDRGLRKYKE